MLQPYELGIGMEVYVGDISSRSKGIDAGFGGDEYTLIAVRPEVAVGEAFVGRDIRVVLRKDGEHGECLYQFCYNHGGALEAIRDNQNDTEWTAVSSNAVTRSA